jgi:hypothetical protein
MAEHNFTPCRFAPGQWELAAAVHKPPCGYWIKLTLPLSGRHEGYGGVAKN